MKSLMVTGDTSQCQLVTLTEASRTNCSDWVLLWPIQTTIAGCVAAGALSSKYKSMSGLVSLGLCCTCRCISVSAYLGLPLSASVPLICLCLPRFPLVCLCQFRLPLVCLFPDQCFWSASVCLRYPWSTLVRPGSLWFAFVCFGSLWSASVPLARLRPLWSLSSGTLVRSLSSVLCPLGSSLSGIKRLVLLYFLFGCSWFYILIWPSPSRPHRV